MLCLTVCVNFVKRNWGCFPSTFKHLNNVMRSSIWNVLDKCARPKALERESTQTSRETARARGLAFVGAERDMAQAMAREWYRRQNDTGFAYQAGKKSFDTLVKEAERQVLGVKHKEAQEAKESEDQLVELNQNQIENLERQRPIWRRNFQALPPRFRQVCLRMQQLDLAAARARRAEIFNARTRLAGIEARSEALKSHLRDVQTQLQQLSKIEPQIVQLERTKEIEETNYKYFQSSLEKARVDEALDPSKMPNISVVQSPSIAFKTTQDLRKIVLRTRWRRDRAGAWFGVLNRIVTQSQRKATD